MTRVTFPKLVLFDLDGTLIEPMDFDVIKRVLNVQSPVLENIAGDPVKMSILKDFEIRHATKAKLMPYAKEILNVLEKFEIKKGIITRNCSESVEIVCQRFGLEFDIILTRDNCEVKPSPKPVEVAVKKLNVEKNSCLIVGDYVFDLLAGKNAGIKTALILNGRNHHMLTYSHLADYILYSLCDLEDLICIG